MSDERPRHTHDTHFDELLAGRVVTEAMTEFDAGTPVEEVLRWLHERLSLSEDGSHVVQGMSLDSVRFQPTFTIDAITLETFPETLTMDARLPVTPIDPAFIPLGAWFTGANTIDAFILSEQPTGQYFHYDDFSNEGYSWGSASHVGYYTYTNATHAQNSLKADYDPEPTDGVHDYRGRVQEEYNTFYTTYCQDGALMNKRVLIACQFDIPEQNAGINYRINFRGPNNYIEINNNIFGPSQRTIINGVQVDSGEYFWSMNVMFWLKIDAIDNVVRWKIWNYQSSEPSAWTFEYRNAPLTTGATSINFRGVPYSFITFNPNGSPWTHWFKHLSVRAINAGPLHTSAWLAGRFSADAWFSSGNDAFLDAFISPTFRANALIVEYVPGHFTIGAFKEGRFTVPVSADAFIEGWKTIDAIIADDQTYGSHTADAWKVITTSDTWDADATVLDVDREYPFTGDAITKDLDITHTKTVNAYKNVLVEGDHTIDAFKNPGAHPPFNAVIKRLDQPDDFTAGSWLWPEGVELFVANAVKHQPDSYSGALSTIDAAFDMIGYATPHYDEFDRTYDTDHSGWGNPSGVGGTGRGQYWYKVGGTSTDLAASEMYRYTVSGGTGRFYEKNHHYAVHTEESWNDREVYIEFKIDTSDLVGGTQRFGIIGSSWAGVGNDIRIDVNFNDSPSATQYLVVNGVNRASWTDWATLRWMVIKAKLVGSELWYKMWRRDETSEPAWSYLDMTGYWTPTAGRSYYWCESGNYFGTKGPWTQQISKWEVTSPAGHPEYFKSNAIVHVPDSGGEHTAGTIDGYFVPQPFSADAFIEGWKTIDARIWLGTTFPADAMRQSQSMFGGLELLPSGNVANTTYWQHNNVDAVGSDWVKLEGSGSGSGAIKSKETFGPSYGNAFPSLTNRRLEFWIQGLPRDYCHVFVYNASLGTGGVDSNGGYGFRISDYSNYAVDLINNSTGSSSTWYGSLVNPTKFTIEYEDIGGGQSRMKLYDANDALIRTSASFSTPYWSAFRMGFYTGYGIIGGQNWVWYTPQAGSWRDGPAADAWIVSGAHIPFSAQLTGKNFDAILKTIDNPGSMTLDAYKHILGEQLRSFTADAWAAEYFQELSKTQFGWMELGRQMWGDIWPEVQQLHLSAAAWLAGGVAIDAVIDRGHFWVSARVAMSDAIWYAQNYDESPDTGRKEPMDVWLWKKYG